MHRPKMGKFGKKKKGKGEGGVDLTLSDSSSDENGGNGGSFDEDGDFLGDGSVLFAHHVFVKVQKGKRWVRRMVEVTNDGWMNLHEPSDGGGSEESLPLNFATATPVGEKKYSRMEVGDALRLVNSSDQWKATYLLSAETPGQQVQLLRALGKSTDLTNPVVFGVSLDIVLAKGDYDVPPVITDTIQALESALDEEGLFRLSGSAVQVEALKDKFNAGAHVDLGGIMDPHVISTCLKQFVRELSEPLLPYDLFDEFLAVGKDKAALSTLEGLRRVAALLRRMPDANWLTFEHLFSFLQRVAERSEKNKMGPPNLATVFGPNILRPRSGELDLTAIDPINAVTAAIVAFFSQIKQLVGDPNAVVDLPSVPTPNSSAGSSVSLDSAVSAAIPPPVVDVIPPPVGELQLPESVGPALSPPKSPEESPKSQPGVLTQPKLAIPKRGAGGPKQGGSWPGPKGGPKGVGPKGLNPKGFIHPKGGPKGGPKGLGPKNVGPKVVGPKGPLAKRGLGAAAKSPMRVAMLPGGDELSARLRSRTEMPEMRSLAQSAPVRKSPRGEPESKEVGQRPGSWKSGAVQLGRSRVSQSSHSLTSVGSLIDEVKLAEIKRIQAENRAMLTRINELVGPLLAQTQP